MKGTTGFAALGVVLIFAAVALLLFGCSSDKEASKETTEDATLPGDVGDETLLDTSGVAEEALAEEVAQKEAEKPKPKPKPAPKKEEPPKPKEPEYITTEILPENTSMQITLLTRLATGENKIGDPFRAQFKGPALKDQPLDLPAGTLLEGVIADLNDGKAEGAKALIKLRFTKFILPGEEGIPVEGYVMTEDGSGEIKPGGQGESIARDAGLGAIAGGVIGAVTGKKGDKTEQAAKGAAIGGVLGGIAGAVLHKDQVTLKDGAVMNITLVSPVIQKKLKE